MIRQWVHRKYVLQMTVLLRAKSLGNIKLAAT